MTPTASPVPTVDSKVATVDSKVAKRRRARSKARSRRQAATAGHTVLGRYLAEGRLREVLTQPGAAGSVLVVDRDVATDGDLRLVAHLGAEEPRGNAALACRDYLRYPSHRWCRRLMAEDLVVAPFAERHSDGFEAEAGLRDGQGRAYRLGPSDTGMSIPELRWHRLALDAAAGAPEPVGVHELAGGCVPIGVHERGERWEPVGVRELVGSMESYEPARTLTVRALDRHCGDPRVSTYTLGAELERLDGSRIVLNRGLREAVEAAIASGTVSMSEITVRCGRLKRGSGGSAGGGDTSWLARRVGLMAEGGRGGAPTPWVHSEVLALIARRGLGISPREVELG